MSKRRMEEKVRIKVRNKKEKKIRKEELGDHTGKYELQEVERGHLCEGKGGASSRLGSVRQSWQRVK